MKYFCFIFTFINNLNITLVRFMLFEKIKIYFKLFRLRLQSWFNIAFLGELKE